MEFEDPRLRNILKLKKEFEKELQKMGKLKKIPGTSRRKPAPPKIKVEITPSANVNASETTNLLDINRQDYDATDPAVVRALRRTIAKVGDVKRRTLVEGIIKLLEGDIEGAKYSFSSFESVEFEYMTGLLKLYTSEPDSLDFALGFLKKHPRDYRPYLLLGESMLALGRSADAVKFLDAAQKLSKDPYLDLVLRIYSGDPHAKKIFPVAVNRGGFKALLAMLSVYMEPDRQKAKRIADTLKNRDNACCRYFFRYWTGSPAGEDADRYPFCPRLNVLITARNFHDGDLEFDPRETFLWSDPAVFLFLGFYSFDIGEKKSADEYFEKFKESVEDFRVRLVRSSSPVSRIGMRMFFKRIDDETLLTLKDLTSDGMDSAVKNAKDSGVSEDHVDFVVDFKDPEIVRMLFGQRHCKFLNS